MDGFLSSFHFLIPCITLDVWLDSLANFIFLKYILENWKIFFSFSSLVVVDSYVLRSEIYMYKNSRTNFLPRIDNRMDVKRELSGCWSLVLGYILSLAIEYDLIAISRIFDFSLFFFQCNFFLNFVAAHEQKNFTSHSWIFFFSLIFLRFLGLSRCYSGIVKRKATELGKMDIF